MRHLRSPGVILGLIAILLSVSGSAVAARLITGKQIKDNSITGRDIRNRSIGGADISSAAKNQLAGDKGETGAQGAPGPQGPQGPQGPTGPAGMSHFTVVRSPRTSIPSGGNGSARADCPAGTQAIGTGFDASITDVGFVEGFGSFVSGFFFNNSSITVDVEVQAFCATVAATAARSVTTQEGRLTQMIAAAKAAAR